MGADANQDFVTAFRALCSAVFVPQGRDVYSPARPRGHQPQRGAMVAPTPPARRRPLIRRQNIAPRWGLVLIGSRPAINMASLRDGRPPHERLGLPGRRFAIERYASANTGLASHQRPAIRCTCSSPVPCLRPSPLQSARSSCPRPMRRQPTPPPRCAFPPANKRSPFASSRPMESPSHPARAGN
jgi:hypothetical protein